MIGAHVVQKEDLLSSFIALWGRSWERKKLTDTGAGRAKEEGSRGEHEVRAKADL